MFTWVGWSSCVLYENLEEPDRTSLDDVPMGQMEQVLKLLSQALDIPFSLENEDDSWLVELCHKLSRASEPTVAQELTIALGKVRDLLSKVVKVRDAQFQYSGRESFENIPNLAGIGLAGTKNCIGEVLNQLTVRDTSGDSLQSADGWLEELRNLRALIKQAVAEGCEDEVLPQCMQQARQVAKVR